MTDNLEMKWWPNHFLQRGVDFDAFWKEYLNSGQKNILFILGKGFDPRMNCGINQMLGFEGEFKLTCMVINFQEGEFSPSRAYTDDVVFNFEQLERLLNGRHALIEKELKMIEGKRRIGGRKAAELFSDKEILMRYTDIVVDISAMPRNIYFPLINQILVLLDKADIKEQGKNLHVIVAEDFSQDIRISAKELDENASYMFSFSADMELEDSAETPLIWFPLLGEGKQEEINTIYKLIEPTVRNREIEICPIFPFPARNPRRVDDLIIDYHKFFEIHNIEPRNIIFADEQNPFDVYRQVRNAGLHYDVALKPLYGCRKVITATSSKLLSLGALMAAQEGDMAVAFVGAQGYTLDEEKKENTMDVDCELFEIWLAGEPYS